ncbi:MAG: hypothetical protein A2Y03_00570 [Omnitrophica WOR_2 bacterium GWF2_38_59]|nr:MAG: hypothetical protein A2Y03_00570 [Omnitrophica WOR_2 bacterium GWF2_38_59]OGX49529.1 MAG: hypothetical protein A2243_10635 [Omnitrophica WOR_2 bacterium RIFOXYA2_FULL_38_17]OGX58725.1 MAG: hypothetical protein A2306_12260 [Omnitrophica WOR_2 bacterium RIFOXYB2_FULL_38_16]HBG62166.1 hydrolase TatD [Candidatus Omnitrophota bacterium]
MSEFVDCHCHLDLFEDHIELLRECDQKKINVLTVTNAPCVWKRNYELAMPYKYIRVALGLHPQLAEERKNELGLFEKYIKETRFIGEIGLDGSKEYIKSLNVQEEVFKRILKLCSNYNDKILSVHSRNAARNVVMNLKAYYPIEKGKVILHWYSGSLKDAISAVRYGCYFSVNERMLQTQSGISLIKNIPRNRILTETDGPFLKRDEKPLRSMQVNRALNILSKIWGIDMLQTKEVIFVNFNELIK